jgi:hypothetical protein
VPVAIDQPGLHDLARLGHPAAIVLDERHRTSPPIPFAITPGGHRRYPFARVRLRARVRIAGSTTGGAGYLEVLTGHGSSASPEFVASRRGGRLRIEWSTVDVNGERVHRARGRSIDVDFTNYVLFDDAGAGRHSLRFKLTRLPGFHFERVTISPTSGIELTSASPYPLTASARSVDPRDPVAGRPTTLEVRVHNRGDRPARRVVVALQPDRGIRLVGAIGSSHWPDVAPGRTVTRRVRAIPLTPGEHRMEVSAASSVGSSAGTLVVEARAAAGDSGGGVPAAVWWAAGGLLVAGGAAVLLRRRSGRPAPPA